MAHICMMHHPDDLQATQQVADILYFMNFDVSLHSHVDQPGEQHETEDFSAADLIVVVWTPNSKHNRWLVAQCRNFQDSDKLMVVVSKAAKSFALPLMLHRGCVVRLDEAGGRIGPSKLQMLLAEVGVRTGREGLVTCVSALLRPSASDRAAALLSWVQDNPRDALVPAIETALEENSTEGLYDSLIGLMRRQIKAENTFEKMVGGVASEIKKSSAGVNWRLAGVGAVALIVAGVVVLPWAFGGFGGKPEANAPVQVASTSNDFPGVAMRSSAAAGDIFNQTDVELPPVLEMSGTEELVPDDGLYFTDVADSLPETEPRLDVPDEPEINFAVIEMPNDADISERAVAPEEVETAIENAETPDETSEEELEEDFSDIVFDSAKPSEPLMPYIAGEHGPGHAFQDGLSDGVGGPEMVVVPAGSFRMGSPLAERGRDPSEGPQRTVNIAAQFAAGKYEVTVAQFAKFVDATGYDAGSTCQKYINDQWAAQEGASFLRPGYRQTADHPATCVDWFAATAYADWLSDETGHTYRLLSEAEWEYIARAGSSQPYAFGASAADGCGFMQALSCTGSGKYSAPVGSYLPNALGLHDLHGNVWEWTQDIWHTSYADAPSNGAPWQTGQFTQRIIRGGSWFSYDFWLRSAARNKFAPSDRQNDIGFRVAREL